MIKNVHQLTPNELNAWVAKSLGYSLLGEAYCSYSPSDGSLSVDMEQKPKTGHYPNHLRYCYVTRCDCDLILKTIDSEDEDKFILGHSWMCLQPVGDYSDNYNWGMPLSEKMKIALNPNDDDSWTASKDGLYVVASTQLIAIMKLLVISHFGEDLDMRYLISVDETKELPS